MACTGSMRRGQRHPQLGAVGMAEVRRHHAHDSCGASRPGARPDRPRRSPEAPLPQAVAQQHDRPRSRLVLFRENRGRAPASRRGRRRSCRTRALRYVLRPSPPPPRVSRVPVAAPTSSKTAFDWRQRCQVIGASASCASSPPACEALVEPHQPIRLGERQGPQQHGPHDREDRGVRADAQPKDEHHHCRERLGIGPEAASA